MQEIPADLLQTDFVFPGAEQPDHQRRNEEEAEGNGQVEHDQRRDLAIRREHLQYRQRKARRIEAGNAVLQDEDRILRFFAGQDHRCRGIAGRLLNTAVADLRKKGVSPVYLVTDHTGFYERYGWEFLCPVHCEGEDGTSRMYVRR